MRSDDTLLTPDEAFAAVRAGKFERYARPGLWRVFRDGARVVFELLRPANDPDVPPPMPLNIA